MGQNLHDWLRTCRLFFWRRRANATGFEEFLMEPGRNQSLGRLAKRIKNLPGHFFWPKFLNRKLNHPIK